jgi:hypothetical protein
MIYNKRIHGDTSIVNHLRGGSSTTTILRARRSVGPFSLSMCHGWKGNCRMARFAVAMDGGGGDTWHDKVEGVEAMVDRRQTYYLT